MTRRDVLKLPLAALSAAEIHSACAATPFSMPGLFRGKVVGIEHSQCSIDFVHQAPAVQDMVRRGMVELTGMPNYVTAWRRMFHRGDRVAIKVNPNGNERTISSPACLREIISGLLSAGVLPNDIVVCERYKYLLDRIAAWVPAGVRTAWATPTYTDDQTSISGYDPEHYVDLPQYLLSWQDVLNERHRRSHAALYFTRQATKIISLSVLKDHQASGVTLGLKNIGFGGCNNVNRGHPTTETNHLKYVIPAMVAMPVIRNKVVLSIIDGVHGLFAGGPEGWWPGAVWPHKTMYFATDVVAGDRVGWRKVDEERARRGMPPEAEAGLDGGYGGMRERHPQHIEVAGQLGLGTWRDTEIDYRHIKIG